MKLAWLSKNPPASMHVRGEAAGSAEKKAFPKSLLAVAPMALPDKYYTGSQTTTGSVWALALERVTRWVKDILFTKQSPSQLGPTSFLLPEQKHWKEKVESYAESPFEKMLFTLKKKPQEYVISNAWVAGIKSRDPLTREAAVSLFKAYLAYQGLDTTFQLSPHTQMKLLMFSAHLTEGMLGKAKLYEAILGLPLPQFLEFAPAFKKDFGSLPPMAQAILLKQLLAYWKKLDKTSPDKDTMAYKKLMKLLVVQFYTNQQESMAPLLQQQEKIRLGFLKIQPIEDAYRKHLEEIEKRYRFKLRQLKKRRTQKVAEAHEEKMRRIEMIYDSVENNLVSGLSELTLDMDAVTAEDTAVPPAMGKK